MNDAEIRAHTALHIVKGAVQMVLNATLTNGVWIGEGKARLSVEFQRKPEEPEMKAVEEAANMCVGKAIPIRIEELDRKEAESKYGSAMYDAYPVPAEVNILKVVSIVDGGLIWNVNACIKPHTASTSDVGKIEIERWRYREPKKTLEISFKIL